MSCSAENDRTGWRIATWNLDWWRRYERRRSPWELIAALAADFVALQEVGGRDIAAIRESHPGPSLFSHELHPSATLRWMGCGLLLPPGARVLDAGLIDGLPKPQRSLWARVAIPQMGPLTIVSWHAPNAAGDGRETKMQGFRAATAWLCQAPRPLLLGADLNAAGDPPALRDPDPEGDWFEEHDFNGPAPRHRLFEAYRTHITATGELDRISEESPTGPLAVSYRLANGTPHRMDRIFCSEEFTVVDAGYRPLEEARKAGSDHALHWADVA